MVAHLGRSVQTPRLLGILLAIVADAAARAERQGADELLAALRRYRDNAHLGASLEHELGLATRPGETPWHARLPLDEVRAGLVHELEQHLRRPSLHQTARAISDRASDYAARRWPHVRRLDRDPSADPVNGALFELQRLYEGRPGNRAGWPLGWRSVTSILQTRPGAAAKALLDYDPANAGDHSERHTA